MSEPQAGATTGKPSCDNARVATIGLDCIGPLRAVEVGKAGPAVGFDIDAGRTQGLHEISDCAFEAGARLEFTALLRASEATGAGWRQKRSSSNLRCKVIPLQGHLVASPIHTPKDLRSNSVEQMIL